MRETCVDTIGGFETGAKMCSHRRLAEKGIIVENVQSRIGRRSARLFLRGTENTRLS